MKRSLVVVSALFALMLSVTAAQADVISSWDYSVQGIFTNWTNQTGVVGSVGASNSIQEGYTVNNILTGINATRIGSGGTTLNYDSYKGIYGPGSALGYTSLRWGSGTANSGYSSIGLDGMDGTVTTDSGALTEAPGLYLWHNNNPLLASVNTLVSGTTLLTLALSPADSGSWFTYAKELSFHFVETTNSGAYQNDIFIMEDPFASSTEKFTVDGIDYFFSFGASFAELTGGYLSIAQTAMGVSATTKLYGWVTTENGYTAIPTYLTLHYATLPPSPTPEPATMVLFGIGLAGLGLMARRRRQA